LIRRKALKEIKKLQDAGVEIIIVSASSKIGEKMVRCTAGWIDSNRMEKKNGLITGKIEGLNCHGEEKTASHS
jgi:phosphoserine phosphatase